LAAREVPMAHLISSILVKRELIFVHPDLDIQECVKIMNQNRIGAVVVKDEEQDLILGIISERDITRKLVAQNLDPLTTKASDIVYSQVSILSCHEPIEEAMKTINNTRRRHVLIEDEGRVISILSIGDLMKHVLNEKEQVIEHLENYIYS
jgi:CBS domain-containing protein